MSTISLFAANHRLLIFGVCFGLVFSASSILKAAPFEETEPTGRVWFFGTVEQVVDGVPLIDLGEVHTLRRGSVVAAVQHRDSHFIPLGLLEVEFSNPTWCQTRKPVGFKANVGDIVMFVETPGDLGNGERLQDSFVRHRIVANSNRNGYSTMRDEVEADTMQRLIEKQPGWVDGNRRVAGVVRTPSVSKDLGRHLVPFMNQVMLFQDYEDKGIDVAQVVPESWKQVMTALRARNASPEAPVVEVAATSVSADPEANAAAAITVRRMVDTALFQRFPEERHLIATMCVALLGTKTSNERQWFSQQFAKSQFPALGDQEQMLVDIEAIMRKVRKTLE